MMYYNGYYGVGHMLGWGLFGILISILIWIFVIWLIIAIVRRIIGGPGWHHSRHDWREWRRQMRSSSSALDILDERYAKGDINKEEYEQKKKDIAGQ